MTALRSSSTFADELVQRLAVSQLSRALDPPSVTDINTAMDPLEAQRLIAIASFRCPVCHARPGDFCRTPQGVIREAHQRRVKRATPTNRNGRPLIKGKGSVRTISGGAVEQNRRRH